MTGSEDPLIGDLLRPLRPASGRWYAWVALLGVMVAAGLFAWSVQMWRGFGITGIRWPVYWGVLVTDFVFWIGISHAGTLISAILRLVDAEWRRPVTRCAEVITAFALMIGGLFPIIHLGRPWLFFWLMPYPNSRTIWPNFRSPLVWDFFAISTYLIGSLLFLFLPMIPDLAMVRDRSGGWRGRVYGVVALGWRGTTTQWCRLESAMRVMAIAIIPVAVSVHTIVSFDFSMAPVPMWQSTIFGPYFVAGAIFSGIAGLIIAMAALRRFLHLEAQLQPVHFDNLGKLLLTMSLLWGYFTFSERLTVWYGNHVAEASALFITQKGAYAPLFWTMVVCNFVAPVIVLGIRRFRTITGCVLVSIGVCCGMWLERFLIIVPALGHKYLPYTWGTYRPRPSEIVITVSTLAAAALLYTLFAKFVPIVSMWEMKSEWRAGDERESPGMQLRRAGGAVAVETAGGLPGAHAAAKTLYVLYDTGEAAQQAVNDLRAAGVKDHEIAVITSRPMADHEFSRIGSDRWTWRFACAGGLCGLLFAAWLTRFTETRWPLITGNMPIVTWWPNLIVMFELTMLGAMLATAATFLVSAGLLRRRPCLYDPAVSAGKILVGVDRRWVPGEIYPGKLRKAVMATWVQRPQMHQRWP